MSLKEYHRKRKFDQTPEPRGAPVRKKQTGGRGALRFVVQLHHATRTHYDFRLEFDGTLKSWAIPKGPSLNPLDQRLAVFVEDHPIEYGSFEGIIPRGNYGAGTVMLWDHGTFHERSSETREESQKALLAGLAKGHVTFVLDGEKLKGEFALIRLKRGGDSDRNWLLVKKRDEFASFKRVEREVDRSVVSGRTMGEIAAEAASLGEIWIPGRGRETRPRGAHPESARSGRGAESGGPARSGLGAKTGRSAKSEFATESADRPRVASARARAKSAPAPLADRASPSAEARARAMPRRTAPMLPVHGAEGEGDWIYEPCFGTRRAIAEVDRTGVRLYSRQFLPYEKRYPEIAAALRAIGRPCVLDGEIGADGRYHVIDLLYADGQDLRALPLRARLARLEQLALGASARKSAGMSAGKSADPTKLAVVPRSADRARAEREAARAGAPELLARELGSVYRSGTSSAWRKFPAGTPTTRVDSRARVDSAAGRNVSAGSRAGEKAKKWKRVSEAVAHETSGQTEASAPPTSGAKSEKWKGEKSQTAPGTARARRLAPLPDGPPITNLTKIYFPRSRITKGDLIAYYREVAPELVLHLKDRPESMHRHPNGIARGSFFHKDLTGYRPRWLKTERIYSESAGKTIEFLLCQDARSLEYMANLGCIELNPWLSRVGSLDRPDYSIIDLDPDDSNDFRDVVEAARVAHRVLESIGAVSFCKTSGSTGLHIAIPFGARHDYDAAREFALAVCEKVHAKMPEVTSLERNPARRRGKIYLDFLQNRRGQTLAAPYCVRPREGAPVSTPLKWSEVKPGLDPTVFTIQNTRRRLDRVGDLWRPTLGASIALAQCLKKLGRT